METKNQLATIPTGEEQLSFIERFVIDAKSLDDIKKVGMTIIESGFCPEHFKQSKDAVGVIMCIEAGRKLGISWMQALSDLYPVKGRVGMMGVTAKAIIFSSGLCESWEEKSEGEYPNNDYKYIIISKRKGFPKEFRTEFSVFEASTAGLMTKDIYKKYGKRMIMWRCLGNHATDYYTDLMKGMKTVEELNDYDPNLIGGPEGTVTVTTATGQKIRVVNKEKVNETSETITNAVNETIDKENGRHEGIAIEIKTEEELIAMKSEIYNYAAQVLPVAKLKILGSFPGKRSNKLYRECLLAFYAGKIDEFLSKPGNFTEEKTETTVTKTEPGMVETPIPDGDLSAGDLDQLLKNPPKNVAKKAEAKAQTLFAKQDQEESPITDILEREERSFSNIYKIMQLMENAGITEKNFKDPDGKITDLEEFVKTAPKDRIEFLLSKK